MHLCQLGGRQVPQMTAAAITHRMGMSMSKRMRVSAVRGVQVSVHPSTVPCNAGTTSTGRAATSCRPGT